MSVDDAKANAAFRKQHDLPFSLLCDTDRKMSVAYGAAADTEARYSKRIAVLIDAAGRVVRTWKRAKVRTFADDVLAALPR